MATLVVLGTGLASTSAGAIDLGIPPLWKPGFAVSPTTLSRKQPTPVRMLASGQYRSKEGTHLPALRELEIKGDRNLDLNLEDVPVCGGGGRDGRGDVEESCRDALIGSGRATVEIAFPEEPMTWVQGKLRVYNGGGTKAKRRLYAHVYLPAPVTAEIVVPLLLGKIGEGHFGWRLTAEVPKIAGGAGSIFGYSVRIGRRFLTATCPDGSLEFAVTSNFEDGELLSGRVIEDCTVAKAHVRQ